MKKLLNKRGSAINIPFATMFWVLKIFLLIVFLLLTTTLISYQSINKQNQLDIVYAREINLILNEVKSCLEKEISEQYLSRCLNRQDVGVKIISDDVSFVLNPDKFEEEFCNISKKHFCLSNPEISIIKANDKIKKVTIDLVMINE